jgi:hypothetical protein
MLGFRRGGREKAARHGEPKAANEGGDEAAECLITSLADAGALRRPDFNEFLRAARCTADPVTWVPVWHRTGLTAERCRKGNATGSDHRDHDVDVAA